MRGAALAEELCARPKLRSSSLLDGPAPADTRLAVEREEKLLQLASTVEGHVDNLAPCIYGGMQIGVHTGTRWYTTSVNVPQGLQCVMFIPEVRQETEAARAVLPRSIPRDDAVFNIGACVRGAPRG
jgi:homoserine kinase